MKQSYRSGVTTSLLWHGLLTMPHTSDRGSPLHDAPSSHSLRPLITKVENMLPKQTRPTTQKAAHFPAHLNSVPTSPTAAAPTAPQTPIKFFLISGISQEERVQEREKKECFSRKMDQKSSLLNKIVPVLNQITNQFYPAFSTCTHPPPSTKYALHRKPETLKNVRVLTS